MNAFSRLAGAAALTFVLVGSANAGPVADFETAMRGAYADYRAALFQTNANKPEAAAQAVDAFQQKWAALAAANAAAPPQYADDPAYAATLAKVAAIADTRRGRGRRRQAAEAHETLEAIRFEIGGLHERNGIVGFSDRMNAYHAKMEDVLGQGLQRLRRGGPRRARARTPRCLPTSPPTSRRTRRWKPTDPAYATLLDGMTDSVASSPGRGPQRRPGRGQGALGGLKVPYSKLFLKFG